MRALVLCIAVLLAGCAEEARPETTDPPIVSEPPEEPIIEPFVQTWEGYMVVGGAGEVPAHYVPSEAYTMPIWKSGFLLEIQEAPEVLELRVDWTSLAPTMVQFMAHGPHGSEREDEAGWSEYETGFVMDQTLCMSIPATDLQEDVAGAIDHGVHPYWYPMLHTTNGQMVEFTVTVTSVGGNVTIPDGLHGHETTPEQILNAPETVAGPKRAWDACAVSL